MLENDEKVSPAAAMISIARGTAFAALPENDSAAFSALITQEAKNTWFSAYHRERDLVSLREANHIADVLIASNRSGESPEPALIDERLVWRESADHDARRCADEILATYEDDLTAAALSEDQTESLRETLIEELHSAMEGADTSNLHDCWTSHDRAEVLFIFSAKEHAIDAALTSHKSWAEFSEMAVCEDLRHTLACLGYTVGEYRTASKNRHESAATVQLARPAFKRPSPPLCAMDKIAEAIDNACTTSFVFCLYAIVPLNDLIDLDPNKPLTFSKAHIASYSPWAGTFHDSAIAENVTVTAAMGQLISPHGYYSPDDICGLVQSYYHGRVYNADAVPLAKAA